MTDSNQQRLVDIITGAAQAHGVDPNTLITEARIESNMNPNAHNASGASGLFQFMPSTAQQYGLSNPYDPAASADAAARLAAANAAHLENALGRAPTTGEIYLAHQQGAAGATALLMHPNETAVQALTRVYGNSAAAQRAVLQNGGSLNMSAQQFANQWVGRADRVASLIPPMNIPTVGSALAYAGDPPIPLPAPFRYDTPPDAYPVPLAPFKYVTPPDAYDSYYSTPPSAYGDRAAPNPVYPNGLTSDPVLDWAFPSGLSNAPSAPGVDRTNKGWDSFLTPSYARTESGIAGTVQLPPGVVPKGAAAAAAQAAAAAENGGWAKYFVEPSAKDVAAANGGWEKYFVAPKDPASPFSNPGVQGLSPDERDELHAQQARDAAAAQAAQAAARQRAIAAAKAKAQAAAEAAARERAIAAAKAQAAAHATVHYGPAPAANPGQLFAGTNGYVYRQNADGSYTNVGQSNPNLTPAQLYAQAASKAASQGANPNPVMAAITGNSGSPSGYHDAGGQGGLV